MDCLSREERFEGLDSFGDPLSENIISFEVSKKRMIAEIAGEA